MPLWFQKPQGHLLHKNERVGVCKIIFSVVGPSEKLASMLAIPSEELLRSPPFAIIVRCASGGKER